MPVVAPLRRPRSPLPSHKAVPASPRRDFDDIPKNFVPAGGNINFCRVGGGRTSTVGARLGRQPSKPTDESRAAGKAMSKETAKDAPEESLLPRAFRTDQPTPKTKRSTDAPTSVPNAGAPPRSSLKLEDPKPQVKVEANKPPASVADVAPVKKLVPKNYVVETLSIGDVVLLSVDNTAAACGAEGAGFVCLCLHETAAQHYAALCDQYGAACDADKQQHQPAPGETFSYFNQAEGAWYRSRCLGAGSAALLDGSKVVALSAADRCRRLPAEYQHVPEFCCVLQADNVKIGDNLKCTLMAKTPCGYKVSVEDAESGAQRGDGALARWQPRVQHPPAVKPAAAMSKETAKDAPEESLPLRAFRTDQPTPKTKRSTDAPTSVPNAGAPPRSSLKLEDPKPQVKVEANKPPASVADVAPVKKLVPKNYVVETLSIGDVVLLSVDNTAAACGAEGAGFVCLCLHETAAQHYAALCDQYGAACDADKQQHQPAPGETFSYFNQAEGAWYRSRCLGAGSAALLDGSKVVALSAADRCRRLPAEYQHVPEFCCVLQADNVKIGDNLKCTLMAKTPCGYKVSVEDAESGAQRGDGALARWQPRVQHPPALKPATAMSKETAKDAPEESLPPRVFRTDQPTPKTRDVVSLKRSTDAPTSVPNAGAPPRSSLKLEDPKPQVKVEANKPPASVADVAPVKKLVPKNYVVETLSIGDVVLLSVDNTAAACGAEGAGFVCLCLHETAAQHYAALCDQYGAACDADKQQHQPAPGETFSYFNQAEGAWYRSRCLGAGSAALLDGSKVVALSAADRCRRLPAEYQHVPEFCCVLQADNVKIGDNLKCTLMAKTPCGYKVSVEDAESGAQRGDGALARWQPRVQHPPALKPATAQPAAIPEVQRPPVTHGGKVLVVDATAAELVYVRAADTANKMQFDTVLQDVVLHGHTGTPMTEPPQQGQVVIAKFTDGLHYRALVKRTNVKLNKYLLEYIEYGNTHVSPLEDLYACPATLDVAAHPAMTSRVTLRLDADATLAPPAQHYLDKLKEDETELILTLPNGEESAPSGSEVILTVAKNKQCVNKTLQEMCTPDWKKIDEHGGDVVETKNLMFSELRHLELPAQGCEIEVLDFSAIQIGIVSGCERGLPHAQRVFTQLTEQMEKYCNSELCREPYLPKGEELCIAQCPPYPQWFRAVLIGQAAPGGDEAEVMYVDYGNIERVPVTLLRKMLPEFVRGLPAVAATLVIADFPANPTPEMLSKALQHMQVNEEGRGVLRVTKCVKDDCGMYTVHAPALIAAMTQ